MSEKLRFIKKECGYLVAHDINSFVALFEKVPKTRKKFQEKNMWWREDLHTVCNF
ncbi:MAG: hypothetical protein RSA64_07005 [Christensenellaceae bacterium]